MESAPKPSRIIRIDQRYRHATQDVSPRRDSVQERHQDVGRREQEEESLLVKRADEPLLIREQRGRPVMGRAHRLYHRRQADPVVNILTVAVEVIATVDSLGNIIGQETVTVPVPSIQAVPTPVLPVVPSVPAFPSDLTVPAYPWPSGVPSATVADVGSSVVISSPLATASDVNSPAPTLFPSQGFNSTITSTIPSSSFFSTTNSTTSRSSTSSSSSLSSSSSSSRSSSTSTRSSSTSSSISSSSTQATTASLFGGGGGGGAPTNTEPTPAATSSVASTGSSGNGTLRTPEVVGSVIGSLAGAAILLALILFLIKRHKQKQRGGAMQLSGNDATDNAPMAPSGQQQMTTRSSFVPTGAAAFLNRFSSTSKSTAESSLTGGERGFQRISGRKLPSAFSEGMTSEQFSRGEGTLSGSSFYQDDRGFYGGSGSAAGKEFGKETGDSPTTYGAMGTKERMMPSPARTPVVHHPDDTPPWGVPRNGGSTLSPPHSPNPEGPLRPSLGRSQISHDGSRSSKFTENV